MIAARDRHFAIVAATRRDRVKMIVETDDDLKKAIEARASQIGAYERDDEDGHSLTPICPLRPTTDMDTIRDLLRHHNVGLYMRGDCWHMALAFRRLHEFPIVAAYIDGEQGRQISHVGSRLPDGQIVDIRGLHDDLSFMAETNASPTERPIEIEPEEVMATLRTYALQLGEEPVDWDDPLVYPFAARTEDFIQSVMTPLLRLNEISPVVSLGMR